MFTPRTICVALLFSFACGIPLHAEKEGVFSINGKTVKLDHKLLLSFRAKWKEESTLVRAPEALTAADVIWIRDFISVIESLYEENCAPLSILDARPFDSSRDKDETKVSKKSASFDYVWVIQSKHGVRKYRVLNEKGSKDFTVYPLTTGYLAQSESLESRPNKPLQGTPGTVPSSSTEPEARRP